MGCRLLVRAAFCLAVLQANSCNTRLAPPITATTVPPSTHSAAASAHSAYDSRPTSAALTPFKRIPIGKNVWLEVQGVRRSVVLEAHVCLREGMLEQLLCCRGTKEHEAILSADLDARDIQKALLLAGAQPGSPVRYQPRFQPPSGSRIKVSLRYQDHGRSVVIPGQHWIRDLHTKKPLAVDWVFAGSYFTPDPDDPGRPPIFAANSGDVICVSNFQDALLDLPVNSSSDNSELEFEAFSERIPPAETRVTVVLEPQISQRGR